MCVRKAGEDTGSKDDFKMSNSDSYQLIATKKKEVLFCLLRQNNK